MSGNRLRGEVAFPHLGEGNYLRFRTGDLVQLRQKYGQNYREVVMTGLAQYDPNVLIDCLRHGLKQRDQDGAEKPKRLLSAQEEDLPFNFEDVQMLFADALMLAWVGRTYTEVEQARAAAIAESLDAEAPPVDPQTSSSESSPQPPEQESMQSLSGD